MKSTTIVGLTMILAGILLFPGVIPLSTINFAYVSYWTEPFDAWGAIPNRSPGTLFRPIEPGLGLPIGTEITLEAVPSSGFKFDYWMIRYRIDDVTQFEYHYDPTITWILERHVGFAAYFTPVDSKSLTVKAVTPDGRNIFVSTELTGPRGVHGYYVAPWVFKLVRGDTYTVKMRLPTIRPNEGYPTFSHWSDGTVSNPRSVTLTTDTTLVAVYEYEGEPPPPDPDPDPDPDPTPNPDPAPDPWWGDIFPGLPTFPMPSIPNLLNMLMSVGLILMGSLLLLFKRKEGY